jgi:hypothetical protein
MIKLNKLATNLQILGMAVNTLEGKHSNLLS